MRSVVVPERWYAEESWKWLDHAGTRVERLVS